MRTRPLSGYFRDQRPIGYRREKWEVSAVVQNLFGFPPAHLRDLQSEP